MFKRKCGTKKMKFLGVILLSLDFRSDNVVNIFLAI
jgi:hypothetical protein